MQVASAAYRPKGFALDYITYSGGGYGYTFASGETYYIPNSASVGPGGFTFQPGACIKFAPYASLVAPDVPVNFPSSGLDVVFTSKDDDLFGDPIAGSTGNPSYAASPAIWMYYPTSATTVERAKIRWAYTGIQDNEDSGAGVSPAVNASVFQNCSHGVVAHLPTEAIVVSDSSYCHVTYPLSGEYTRLVGALVDLCPGSTDPHISASFEGLNQQQAGDYVPDTMGAAGPDHFMTVLNGQGSCSVAVYDKRTGQKVSPDINLYNFLSVTVNGIPYYATSDPRILYDPTCQRWIACAIGLVGDFSQSTLMLGVSHGPNPVGNGGQNWVTQNWKMYVIPVQSSVGNLDYPTLGVDGNGIYIAVRNLDANNIGLDVVALPKQPFIDETAPAVQESRFIIHYYDPNWGWGPVVQPASNFDPVAPSDPEWLITDWNNFRCAPITWEDDIEHGGRKPILGAWTDLGYPPDSWTFPETAHQLGSDCLIDLDFHGHEQTPLGGAVRNLDGVQNLWTCRNVWVNSDGNNDDGLADRVAVEWLKIQTTPTPHIADWGRIYDEDPNTDDPMSYYYPSIAVNSKGDMVLGFSGSNRANYISDY